MVSNTHVTSECRTQVCNDKENELTGSEGTDENAASLPGNGTLSTKNVSGSIRDHAPADSVVGTRAADARGYVYCRVFECVMAYGQTVSNTTQGPSLTEKMCSTTSSSYYLARQSTYSRRPRGIAPRAHVTVPPPPPSPPPHTSPQPSPITYGPAPRHWPQECPPRVQPWSVCARAGPTGSRCRPRWRW